MRLKLILAVLLVCFVALPLGAQVWEVYDTFEGSLIDRDLWHGGWSDRNSSLDFERQVRGGQLWLRIRTYAHSFFDGETISGLNELAIDRPLPFIGIKAKLTVLKAESNNILEGPGQVTLRATFFNGAPTEPIEQANDIEACFTMMASRDGRTLDVAGLLRGFNQHLGTVVLDTVDIGETLYVWVRWDQPNHRVYYGLQRIRRNAQPVEMAIDYFGIVPDVLPPWLKYLSIQVQPGAVSNTGFQAYSDMLAKVDQVSVLR